MLYLPNCLIRCVCKKSFLSFSYFSMVIKKKMQNQNKFVGNSQSFAPPPPPPPPLLPLYNMCCNIHHSGIKKRKVMGSKLQVTPTKLQVTPTKLQVTLTKLQVTPTKLQVTLTKLQVTPTKLQVTSSKLTNLTAETNKFQLTNMLFITF